MGSSLVALGAALLAAGVLGRLGRRIGLPTIPLFMLAGLLFGPHTPGLDLVHDPAQLQLLAALGLVLLLFSLGLEFSVDELTAGGRRLFGAGAIFLGLNIGAGLAFGFGLGWGNREALVIAGALGISSSAIATKMLVEFKRLGNPESRMILGIIVVEDLFLALFLAVLQPILHDDHSAGAAALSMAKAFGFLLALAVIARYAASFVGRVIDTDDNELLTVCFIGLAILTAGVAEEVGVSDAIGAFMAGLVLAESPSHERISRLVLPIRDTFAALFFFAFGVSIDPGDIPSVAVPIAIAVALTFACNAAAATIIARMQRYDRVATANLACTILARGEFSLILASLAVAAHLDARIGPFVAGYVLVLAVAAPLLAANTNALELTRVRRARSRVR
jgi:CPA2 family monovalent cation:H+ antiporter-2